MVTVFERMMADDINQFPVVDNDGRLLGVIARDNVLAFLNNRGMFSQQPRK